MSGKAPEKPDPPMEDTFAECFGEHLDATQIENNQEACTKGDWPHYPFITEAVFQFLRANRREATVYSTVFFPSPCVRTH